MRIVIGGASGLIGRALVTVLESRGDRVVKLVRRAPKAADEVSWDPVNDRLDPRVLRGADAVISLGGASVGRLPWTKHYRATLWSSRINSTSTVVHALRAVADAGERVPRFVSASATGYFGNAPGVELAEDAPAGSTFLAKLCVAWEREAMVAADLTDVALIRTSPVLHPEGVLRPLIALTRLGLGGPIGSGEQIWPWISLDDEVRAILHVLDSGITGPVNVAGPTAASMRSIGREVAVQLRRPFVVPAPIPPMKLVLSSPAVESLLATDAHVVPRVLEQTGFLFRHPIAQAAIRDSLDDMK